MLGVSLEIMLMFYNILGDAEEEGIFFYCISLVLIVPLW